ncbi:MAG: pilus assembly protein N-terminal domain-containing protein [Myxococcales bacterium]|nr:pilus assembly protein N-terminal domain-containing protein [Myxococcales bacterium]
MTRSLDAAVLAPLAAIVVATAAGPSAAEAPRPVASSPGDAGRGTKPTRLAVGGKLRLGAPITSVRALPAGVVVLLDRGDWTLVEGRTPGHVVIETSASDGGTGDRLEVDVESFMTPERPLVVQPGQSRPLLTPGRVRWSIGDPTVASVTEESGGLEVRGERLGNTTVEAWFEDGSSRKWPVQVEPRFGAGEVRLSIGSQKVLTLPSIGEQSVAPAGIATVKSIGNRQLLIVGTAEGVATLEVAQPGKPALRYRLSVSAEPRPPVIDGAQQRSFPPGSAGPLRLRVGRPLLLVTGDIAQGMASDGLRIDLAAPGVVALTAERPLTGTLDLTRVGGVVEHVEVIVEP